MPRTRRTGELEQLAMLAVWRLGDDAWAGAVREQLEQRGSRSLSLSAVYLTLTRLEAKGYLRSRLQGAQPVRGGKAKRHFHITETGRATLREARARMRAMWDGLDSRADAEGAH